MPDQNWEAMKFFQGCITGGHHKPGTWVDNSKEIEGREDDFNEADPNEEFERVQKQRLSVIIPYSKVENGQLNEE